MNPTELRLEMGVNEGESPNAFSLPPSLGARSAIDSLEPEFYCGGLNVALASYLLRGPLE